MQTNVAMYTYQFGAVYPFYKVPVQSRGCPSNIKLAAVILMLVNPCPKMFWDFSSLNGKLVMKLLYIDLLSFVKELTLPG